MQKAGFSGVHIQSRRGQTPAAEMRCPACCTSAWLEGQAEVLVERTDRRHRVETGGTVRPGFATGIALGFGMKHAPPPSTQTRRRSAGARRPHCALTPSFRNNIKNEIFYFLPINERGTVNQHFDSRPQEMALDCREVLGGITFQSPPLPRALAPTLGPWRSAAPTQPGWNHGSARQAPGTPGTRTGGPLPNGKASATRGGGPLPRNAQVCW